MTVRARRVFETVLYVDDLDAAERFYRDVLGLELRDRGPFYLAFACGEGVVLLFDPEASSASGRSVPSHGARGEGHLAFGAAADELEGWRRRLAEAGVAIEAEVDWSAGGRSIYFRDPAGNSLELAPPTLWGGGFDF